MYSWMIPECLREKNCSIFTTKICGIFNWHHDMRAMPCISILCRLLSWLPCWSAHCWFFWSGKFEPLRPQKKTLPREVAILSPNAASQRKISFFPRADWRYGGATEAQMGSHWSPWLLRSYHTSEIWCCYQVSTEAPLGQRPPHFCTSFFQPVGSDLLMFRICLVCYCHTKLFWSTLHLMFLLFLFVVSLWFQNDEISRNMFI